MRRLLAEQSAMPQPGPVVEPPPLECQGGCGKQIDPVYRKSKYTGAVMWVPGSNPCAHCARMAELDEKHRRMGLALERAKLPTRLQGWDFDRLELQAEGESSGAFMRRLSGRAMSPMLGVLRINVEATNEVREWEPGQSSLFLHGNVGTGKSTLAAALVRKLAVPVDNGWRERTEQEMRDHWGDRWVNVPASRRRVRVITQPLDVLYIEERELMARVLTKYKALDPGAMKQIAARRILVLDDLGTWATTEKDREQHSAVLQALVSYRYDHNLPMIITSNVTWEAVTEDRVYGWRTADRLRQMVAGNDWHMRGPSWRNPPEDKPEPRVMPRPVRDNKAAAAGEPRLF